MRWKDAILLAGLLVVAFSFHAMWYKTANTSGCGGDIARNGAGNIPRWWAKSYGSANDDVAYSIIQTADGGFAVTGYTNTSTAQREF